MRFVLISLDQGAAEFNLDRRIVPDSYLSLEKPGATDMFVKIHMHSDDFARFYLSFELRTADSSENRDFSFPRCPLYAMILKHFCHEKGACLKYGLAKQNTRHKRVAGIMPLEYIEFRGNKLFRYDRPRVT